MYSIRRTATIIEERAESIGWRTSAIKLFIWNTKKKTGSNYCETDEIHKQASNAHISLFSSWTLTSLYRYICINNSFATWRAPFSPLTRSYWCFSLCLFATPTRRMEFFGCFARFCLFICFLLSLFVFVFLCCDKFLYER